MAKKTSLPNGNGTPKTQLVSETLIVPPDTAGKKEETTQTDLPEEAAPTEKVELNPQLTAEDLLNAELKRLEHRSQLALRRGKYIATREEIKSFAEDLQKNCSDEFETNSAVIVFGYGAKKLTITNPFIIDALIVFITGNLNDRINSIETEILGA